MTSIDRRQLAGLGVALPIALVATGVMAEEASKPEIKRSEAKPLIAEYIEKLSAAAKRNSGKEFSPEQKAQLADQILAGMEAQHLYAFVDP
jgi:hypothetical protein